MSTATDTAAPVERAGSDTAPAAIQWWRHQREWLADTSRFRLLLKARQIGASTALAAEALGRAVAGDTVLMVSASERQALELLRRARLLLPLVTASAAGAITVTREGASEIELSTTGRLIAVPATGATTMGFSAHLVLDEAAWMPRADELWQALVPSITGSSRLTLSVVSTPRAMGDRFHKLWTEGDSAVWSKHRVTIEDAVAGGANIDIGALKAALGDEMIWRSAYLCEFVDEQFSLLPYDILTANVDDSLAYHASLPVLAALQGPLYCGLDIGRRHDLTVLAILELGDSQFISRGFFELASCPFDQQEALLNSVMALPQVFGCTIDASGLGLQLAERARQRWGYRIAPVTMTLPVKQQLCAQLARAFQLQQIRIANDQRLLSDLHSVERNVTPGGSLSFAAPRVSGSHADRFIALALALRGCDSLLGRRAEIMNPSPPEISLIPARPLTSEIMRGRM